MTERDDAGTLSAEQLFRTYGRFVAQFLVRLGVHLDDVDDTVQEVFLVVHARGGYRPGRAKPTSYLGAIALRAASTQRRRRTRQAVRSSARGPDELRAREGCPVRKLEVDDLTRMVDAALAQLSATARATLLLADQQGESCTSIAASMGVPVGTVYWRLHRARHDFRRAVQAVCDASGIEPRGLLELGGGV